ncbi:MAG: alcohol dehydrogenase catalytic domain-containing protein [Pseudomonadota bacterium]
MKAAIYAEFQETITVTDVPDPVPPAHGIVLDVRATGVCRSDWHGWMGHDPDITLPHVPGHEMAGVIAEVGTEVSGFRPGDRVTLPFVNACGACPQCAAGHQQVCDRQTQPGFTHWGSFAEFVAVHHADENLVRLPDAMDFVTAASLGCRYATAYRAVVAQGRAGAGETVVVFGCGGVGLAALMIAGALGAETIAVDVSAAALAAARTVGATHCVDATEEGDVVDTVRQLAGGGARVTIDALGSMATFQMAMASLGKRGRHVQVGLMPGLEPPLPVERFIAEELEFVGSHGLQAYRYADMFDLLDRSKLDPGTLVTSRLTLSEGAALLSNAPLKMPAGIAVIDTFREAA